MNAAVAPQAIIAERIAGFIGHLRANDFVLGPAETQSAVDVLNTVGPADQVMARQALKTTLTGRTEEWDRFDELFEAYWHGRGRTRQEVAATRGDAGEAAPSRIWDGHLPGDQRGRAGGPESPADETDGAGRDGTGRLVASRKEALARTDLRHIVDRDEMAEAERLAGQLARAIRYRLSRRQRIHNRGTRINIRRTIRRNLGHAGEPLELVRQRRPDRPVRIVVLLDMSGSMEQYSRFFLQFVKGLVCGWAESDAYLFHTRLVRVTDAMRDGDAMKAMTRLALMAQGVGGGTRIGACLADFNDRHARRAINSRSVVVILSDGYDTDPPEALSRELARLHRKARRIVWLNPLRGWRDYEPVTAAMQAALPHLDAFAAAHSLEALARLEPTLTRL